MNDLTRANPLADMQDDPLANLNDFKPKGVAQISTPAETRAVAQVAKERGFVRRKAEKVPNADGKKTRYFRNGRSEPISFKVTEECKEHFYRLRDEFNQPLGVIFEEALKALETVKPQVIDRLIGQGGSR